ncbi:hypothetical protein [Winogradskya humida]|uniref:Uncharacterized protein n=1 Tax=Winogradskya humida TaxID=113566 RepID=A0ABQ3ZGT7_9ACTN|nr:hypothetical protein [Actinoplanes humidus]GIE17467.1 hypothetical protein Ahu01nite_005690 [Actinoplanes humidus]
MAAEDMSGVVERLLQALAAQVGVSEKWLRDTVSIVRYVGADNAVDIQPVLTEDYVLETVPVLNLKSV